MDLATARWLVSPRAQPFLAEIAEVPDPGALAVATRLRRTLTPERAAAVTAQVTLRREAKKKFPGLAGSLFLTRDGLEQATRWEVARWRAGRLREATGADDLWDLGCGIGADALAAATRGIGVTGVEIDPVTAVFAAANLAGVRGRVDVADVTAIALPAATTALFADPARRSERGRSWSIDDLTPSWGWASGLAEKHRGPVVLKLAPGFPHRLIPDQAEALWVSHRGDLVETSLWFGPGAIAGRRAAVVVGETQAHVLEADRASVPLGPLTGFLHEPDPAVIRARAIGALAERLDAHAVADGVAYLTGDVAAAERGLDGWATSFAVEEVFPFDERQLRAWATRQGVGTLEIKVRGLDVDPAALRRRLRLRGSRSATIVLTPLTEAGRTRAVVVVVHRL
ncbi:MAG: class I SAM-dependent methyltransferase [Propionibacteriaceae bacterium]|jgi:hypothetical protein|nr:class I SAM-dependent methyltransferase [Propionibacteriaceae bacterium]